MKHFRDPKISSTRHVHQGEFAVESDGATVLTTTLGSCVATCLYDEEAAVGGMNHFLLPGIDQAGAEENMFGVNLMELLINNLLRIGADRRRLKAKLFGGGRVIEHSGQIGEKNASFARRFIADEGIPCVSESLEGNAGRRVRFWPTTGRAQQSLLKSFNEELLPKAQPVKPVDDIELF